jgi:diaminopimelate decarboxylase
MVATSACTVYRVTTVKRGALTHLRHGRQPGGVAVRAAFEATVVDRVGGGETVNLVGRHCKSGDQLIDGVALQDPKVGHLVALPVAGALGYTMCHQYNGARRIPVGFADGGTARPGGASRRVGRPAGARRHPMPSAYGAR